MDSYVRDASGALINTDDSYYRAIVSERESRKKVQQVSTRVDEALNEIEYLKRIMFEKLGLKNEDVQTSS